MGNIIDLTKIDNCTKERMQECDRVFGDGYVYISKNIDDVVALKKRAEDGLLETSKTAQFSAMISRVLILLAKMVHIIKH